MPANTGRHETEILYKLPSDHCQLGVLVPWSLDPDVLDDVPEDVEEIEEEILQVGSEPRSGTATESSGGEKEVESQEETTTVEPFSVIEEATRRPPSSLGLVFVLEENEGPIELVVKTQFAVYTRHFPSYEEQSREIGSGDEPDKVETAARPRRRNVSLVEKCKRHIVDIPPISFTLTTGPSRQTDRGVIQDVINSLLSTFQSDRMVRREFTGHQVVPVDVLKNEVSYYSFLESLTGSPELPPLRVSLRLRSRIDGQGNKRIELFLCNETPRDTIRPFNDQFRILADASLEVGILNGKLAPAELLPVPADYQYDRRVYSVGRNVSVEVSQDQRHLRTRALARYEQPRTMTNNRVTVLYSEVAEDPFDVLDRVNSSMRAYADDWSARVIGQNIYGLSSRELNACQSDLDLFRQEVEAFEEGIAALAADSRLEAAFRAMNRAFAKGKHSEWRLFQIIFIVSQLPALAIREGITNGEWQGKRHDWENVLERADVLWFPTGGGKTEAYLGLISCAALYDRLRGKHFGVTAWLRFPLRTLSVQQLQRAIRVLWNTEIERLNLAKELAGDQGTLGDPISLGYLVGSSNTPNRYHEKWSFRNLAQDPRLRERLLLIPDCPACETEGSVEIRLDETLQRAKHVCKSCDSELPVYVSDEEVYRFLPSLIIGTVDKMAAIAYQPKVAMIWSGPGWKCDVTGHGYGTGDWCITGCPTNRSQANPQRLRKRPIAPYDPAPSFHVQDELHLLQEELGAFAGHYETMVRGNEAAVSRMPSKVIAATATISGYEHQARQIYGVKDVRRFPNRGYSLIETFYSSADPDPDNADGRPKTMRIFAAFRPPYLRAADAAALCSEILHEAINELQSDPYGSVVRIGLQDTRTAEEVERLLGYYSRTLTYVGKRDSGTRIKEKLERDSADRGSRLRPANERELNVEYLASHSTLKEIAETIKRAEADIPWRTTNYLDATVATDVISHGVDVDRYNLMILERIPEQIAAYIQVSSRSGRQHTGLVLSVLPRYSIRASSIYDRFPEFHRHLDRMVTPVPVNRFAKTAIDRSFPGVLLGTLYGRHLSEFHGTKSQQLRLVAGALRDDHVGPFSNHQLLAELMNSYALNEGAYDSTLEHQMEERLNDRYERFKIDIRNPVYDDLTRVFEPRPMTSLRDVDIAVPFRPDDQEVDWRDLQWFQLHH
ncbi:MAG: hypothetical protein IBX64_10295 [Actinobacteria bacterium]|nr:hypothetical protein [Actinomycetota bacterium]